MQDIFKVMKGGKLQPKLLYSAKLTLRFDGEIKSFAEKQNLREFSTTKPALQYFTINTKGISLYRKHKRKKRSTKPNPE